MLILSPVRKCGFFMVLNQTVCGVNDQQNPANPDQSQKSKLSRLGRAYCRPILCSTIERYPILRKLYKALF